MTDTEVQAVREELRNGFDSVHRRLDDHRQVSDTRHAEILDKFKESNRSVGKAHGRVAKCEAEIVEIQTWRSEARRHIHEFRGTLQKHVIECEPSAIAGASPALTWQNLWWLGVVIAGTVTIVLSILGFFGKLTNAS